MCELVIVGEFMKKIVLIIVVTLVIFLILSAVVIYNKIDYVYLNINGKNKQDVVSLLEEQNDYMFNITLLVPNKEKLLKFINDLEMLDSITSVERIIK